MTSHKEPHFRPLLPLELYDGTSVSCKPGGLRSLVTAAIRDQFSRSKRDEGGKDTWPYSLENGQPAGRGPGTAGESPPTPLNGQFGPTQVVINSETSTSLRSCYGGSQGCSFGEGLKRCHSLTGRAPVTSELAGTLRRTPAKSSFLGGLSPEEGLSTLPHPQMQHHRVRLPLTPRVFWGVREGRTEAGREGSVEAGAQQRREPPFPHTDPS